jgi:uncharacterized protein (TIGR02265 family)
MAFKDYPMRRFMELLLEGACQLASEQSPGRGLRALGKLAFPALSGSVVGKVIFSVAGRDWPSALHLAPKAYKVSTHPGTASVVDLGPNYARVELRNLYNFGDSYHVGVFEGAMASYGVQGQVAAECLSRGDTDLRINW